MCHSYMRCCYLKTCFRTDNPMTKFNTIPKNIAAGLFYLSVSDRKEIYSIE